MPDATFPGPLAPALPSIGLTIPAGWEQQPAGDALLRVVGPDGSSTPSVLEARVLTLEGSTEVGHVLEDERALVLARDTSVVDAPFAIELAGHDFSAFNSSWESSAGAHIQVFLVGEITRALRGAVRQLLCLRGRVSGSTAEQDYATIQSILESIVVSRVDGA